MSACWASPSLLVTASWDATVAFLQATPTSLTKQHSLPMTNQATAVAMLPTLGLVAVGTKASNYLRLVNPTSHREVGKVNMNALGDECVSFYCAAMAVSPCGHMLLVATDQPRVLLLEVGGMSGAWRQMRNLYDLRVEAFQVRGPLWIRSLSTRPSVCFSLSLRDQVCVLISMCVLILQLVCTDECKCMMNERAACTLRQTTLRLATTMLLNRTPALPFIAAAALRLWSPLVAGSTCLTSPQPRWLPR